MERTIQTVKKLLSKALSSHQDPCLAILENRNTPGDGFATPSQLVMSRNLRSTIPALRTHFNSLPSLEEGEHVRMRDGKRWKHVTVTKNASEPRSYIVKNPEGKYRRNQSNSNI